MEQHQVAHCLHDMRPLQVPMRLTAPTVYIRFHGDATHGGDYLRTALETWADRIAGWRSQGRALYVYFNNDIGGYAIHYAQTLRHLLAE
jgi:uncharacterized protein YecE (DUF72 family)